ncbi:hypothetical protein [Photobacterium nomapromontoriensis]|uniref:hypothetical protein n=1 Tax=Photobacterium nomapromontoriensis TaxID=2910237 RepID=UPI003D0E0B76
MKFKQKKWSNKINFNLNETFFEYYEESEFSSETINISYDEILPLSRAIKSVDKNLLFMIGTISFFVVSLAQFTIFMAWKGEPKMTMLSVSIVLYFMFRHTRTEFTVLCTDRYNVKVMKDKHHDEIISELYKRRKNALRSKYFEIDMNNGIEEEISKIDWLLENEIIDKEEYDDYLLKLKTYSQYSEIPANIV